MTIMERPWHDHSVAFYHTTLDYSMKRVPILMVSSKANNYVQSVNMKYRIWWLFFLSFIILVFCSNYFAFISRRNIKRCHFCWCSGDYQSEGASVLVVSRWLWPRNRTYLDVLAWWLPGRYRLFGAVLSSLQLPENFAISVIPHHFIQFDMNHTLVAPDILILTTPSKNAGCTCRFLYMSFS